MPDDDDEVTGWRRAPGSAPALLSDIVRGALDPAYFDASRRGTGQPATSTWARLVSLSALLVIGLLVSVAVHRQAEDAPEQARARAALAAGVEAEAADTRKLAARLIRLDEEIRTARGQERSDAADAAELTKQDAALAPAIGRIAVRGPGVQVRITESPSSPADLGGRPGESTPPPQVPAAGRVLDQDIAELVNVMWAAGADAVAVNGVRLTPLTAIRSVNWTVHVGFRPLAPPYLIEAIGDTRRLADILTVSPTTGRLRAARAEFGGDLVILAAREVTLPAAPAPVTTPKHAGGSIP